MSELKPVDNIIDLENMMIEYVKDLGLKVINLQKALYNEEYTVTSNVIELLNTNHQFIFAYRKNKDHTYEITSVIAIKRSVIYETY